MFKKYYINTYGCQMNVHESEKLAGIMCSRGLIAADALEDADIIVFNTCCVRESAEARILGNLGIVKHLKEKRPEILVAVCGCMAQQKGAADRLMKRCPFINIVFGTHNLNEFGKYLDRINEVKHITEIWDKEQEIAEDIPVYRTSGINAWVNIMYGCNNFCSYCIVPYVRGRERSRDEKRIISDVKNLLSDGYKEITLLGQNVNSYGNDFKSDVNFAKLLSDISSLDGNFRLKFMTSHPKDISEDVVKIISQSDKISKAVHLPFQSGSDNILKAMNRRYSQQDYLSKIDMIRKYIPEAGLSSDIIVGFPGETDEDFNETVKVINRVRFNNLFTFIYSKRSGTPAEKMEAQIPLAIKKQRIKQLISRQFEIGSELAADCIGKTYKVLVDSFDGKIAQGKSQCEKAISFQCEKDILGKFINVKIIRSKNNKLFGEITGE